MTGKIGTALLLAYGSKKEIKLAVIDAFRDHFNDPGMSWKEVQKLHFGRNKNQKKKSDFFDVVDSHKIYDLYSDDASLFHIFNFGKDKGNKHNVKFSSNGGRNEYVFGFNGEEIKLVKSELNMGSYNFVPHSADAKAHLLLDVAPWILLGNTLTGLKGWTSVQRQDAFADGWKKYLPGGGDAFPDKGTAYRYGSGSDDEFTGNNFKRVYVGRAGEDTVDYSKANTSVAVNLAAGKGYFGTAKGDQFKSIENIKGSRYGDILIGDGSDNTFTGNGGKDQFSGKGGDDTFVVADRKFKSVIGGKGQDVLEIAKNGPKSIDFSKLKSVEVLDLRNINPEKFDFSNMKGIKEVWVDELFDPEGYTGNAKFVYFGSEEVTFDLYPGSPLSEELFGGHEFSLGEPAKGEASFSITIHINMRGLFGSSEPEWLELYALEGTNYYHNYGDSTEQLQVTGSTQSGFLNMLKWLVDGVGPARSEEGFELTSSVNLFKLFEATGSDRAFDFSFSELEEIANASTSNQIETLRAHTYELMIALFTDATISGGVEALAPDSFPTFSLLLE